MIAIHAYKLRPGDYLVEKDAYVEAVYEDTEYTRMVITTSEAATHTLKMLDVVSIIRPEARRSDPAPVEESKPPSDMKAGLGGVKAPLDLIPQAPLVYSARGFQYGSDRYEEGNYLRAADDDLARMQGYLAALLRHTTTLTTAIQRYKGTGEGLGPEHADADSGLPELCHIASTACMLIQQAVDAGLIPEDPGITWDREEVRKRKVK